MRHQVDAISEQNDPYFHEQQFRRSDRTKKDGWDVLIVWTLTMQRARRFKLQVDERAHGGQGGLDDTIRELYVGTFEDQSADGEIQFTAEWEDFCRLTGCGLEKTDASQNACISFQGRLNGCSMTLSNVPGHHTRSTAILSSVQLKKCCS